MKNAENLLPSSSPDNTLRTPDELRADRATLERLAAPSPWLKDSVSPPSTIATSEAVVLTSEQLQAAYDLGERLQKPSARLNIQ